MNEQKETYRKQARLHQERRAVDQSDFEKIVDVFFDDFDLEEGQSVALYWPFKKEFDCRALMDELIQQGVTVALPVMQKDTRILDFVQWTHDTEMKKNDIGIMEPQGAQSITPDIVIAPLLAFDQKGYRLGQGGGYYDTTIAALREKQDTPFIGIGYFDQAVLFDLPREEHDIRLDYLLTPDGIKEF